jgi:hypothetical protein
MKNGLSLVTHHFRWAVCASLSIMVAGCGAKTGGGGTGDLPDASPDGAGCRPAASVHDSGGATACSLPFDPGPCQAAFPVFAFVDGVCVERVYGGCGGNTNRFPLLEQCMAACEGRPEPCGCPPGRIAKRICVECGIAGGCEQAEVCAKTCAAPSDCSRPYGCFEGVCEVGPCVVPIFSNPPTSE